MLESLPTWGSTNFFEALRVVLSACAFGLALWGLGHANDGQYAFAEPIRAVKVARRKMQMRTYMVVALANGVQAVVAAATPDAGPLVGSTLTGNLSLIITLLAILFVAWHQIVGWTSDEEVLGQHPLQPTTDERVAEAAAFGRRLLHQIGNDQQVVQGALDLLGYEAQLTPEQVEHVQAAMQSAEAMTKNIAQVHAIVRSLSAEKVAPA